MTIWLPTTCCINGVSGWKLNHKVTLIGSFPTAGVMALHPGPGAGRTPSPPRGPLGTPLPAVTGAVVKIQPQVEGGKGRAAGAPPLLWMGPLGHGCSRDP